MNPELQSLYKAISDNQFPNDHNSYGPGVERRLLLIKQMAWLPTSSDAQVSLRRLDTEFSDANHQAM